MRGKRRTKKDKSEGRKAMNFLRSEAGEQRRRATKRAKRRETTKGERQWGEREKKRGQRKRG
jgi:hypothetical protein